MALCVGMTRHKRIHDPYMNFIPRQLETDKNRHHVFPID